METCCRYKGGRRYLWPNLGKWKDERWIGAFGLCGRKVKGQGQRRVLPDHMGVSHMHGVRGLALNAGWSSFGTKWIILKLGGMCWHHFLTRVKEGDFNKGKVPDLKEIKRWTGLESAIEPVRWTRWICFEDADSLALVLGRWRVANEVKEEEEDPDSTKILTSRL